MIPEIAFRVYYSKLVEPNVKERDDLVIIDHILCEGNTLEIMKHFWA